MARQINFPEQPEAGNVGEPHGGDTAQDDAVADAELMVWGAKAALNMAERNLRVAYETLASVVGARDKGALPASPLDSAEESQLGPDNSSGPDAPA